MHLSLRKKVLITTTLLVLCVLGATDVLWVKTVQPILYSRLEESQQQIGFRAAEKVRDYVSAKVLALIIHSQSAAFLTQNHQLERIELLALLSQDKDIERLALIDMNGKEDIAINKTSEVESAQLQDRSKSPAFLFTTFRYGREYVSDVVFEENKPKITFAIPIAVPESRQRLTDLTTAGAGVVREPGDILGVLEVKVNLESLFDELTSLGSQQSGYLYVVDQQGRVIAHRDHAFITSNNSFSEYLPVKQFLSTSQKEVETIQTASIREYENEYKQSVLGTFVSIPRLSWAVIIQQPYSIAMADISRIISFALILLIVGIGVLAPTIYVMTRRFTDPIGLLVQGANALGQGNFDYRVNIHSHDEIETLGHSFNTMAAHIGESRKQLKADKEIISGERNKLATILSGISDAVIAVDRDRRVILFNAVAAEITGMSELEAKGQRVDQIITMHNGDTIVPPELYCPITSEEESRILWSKRNLKIVSHANKERFINVVAGQIKEGFTLGIGCILTIHDVSKERQLEEMKLDFVSMAAHELRTPLTAIRGYTEILKQKKRDPEEAEIVKRLGSSSENLSGLIDNLLNTSRIENGKFTLETSPTNISTLIQEVMEMLEDQFEMKHIKTSTIGLDLAWPMLLVDPMRIREVVTNLLSNAIRYTQAEGSVTVAVNSTTRDSKPYLRVAISDTGHGIPEDAIAHLFTKFYRVHGTLEMGSKGTGLGLFISKSIIDMHKGFIGVTSEVGKGSTFAFELPVPNQEELSKFAALSGEAGLQSKTHGVILNPNTFKL